MEITYREDNKEESSFGLCVVDGCFSHCDGVAGMVARIYLKIAPFPKEERCAVMNLSSIAPKANFNEEKQMLLVAYRASAEGPLLPSSASAVSGCE